MSLIELAKDRLNVVVAYTSKSRYIGLEGDLPWKRDIKGDMRYIAKLIRLHPDIVLVVGRRTYEGIRRIKDVRKFVVTSAEPEDGMESFKSFSDAVQHAMQCGLHVIVFGGQAIYEEALNYECRIFCTVIEEGDLRGDRVFPDLTVALDNVSHRVEQFLSENGVTKTWTLEDGCLHENGYEYRFFIGDYRPQARS